MATITEDQIQVGIPFAIPLLGLTEPTTISINKAYFQLAMRILVGVCAMFLFWPKISRAFGLSSGPDMEAQRKDIQERIAKLEHERDMTAAKKSYGVVSGTATTPKTSSATPAPKTGGPKETGGAKRRKA